MKNKKSKTSYLEDLWDAANKLRAASNLKVSEFSTPVLGLIFLKYADYRFKEAEKNISKISERTSISLKDQFQAEGVLFLPEECRYEYLLNLPESTDIAKKINNAMSLIEQENKSLAGILHKNYQRLDNDMLISLLKKFNEIDMSTIEGDAFGKVYEFFLGKFASAEGQRGGEFFTPTSIVKLIVEILKPIKGYVFDPACGSGGMFVQSAEFIKRNCEKDPNDLIKIFGQEKTEETAKLCKMNLAVHRLEGEIKTADTMLTDAVSIEIEDTSKKKKSFLSSFGRMNFVMANPPFNVSGVDKKKIGQDKRYQFGLPKVDNANYLWIQCFYSALAENGKAGFVMANSASDARQVEQDIRSKIIKEGVVDVMISVGSNFFHNVTLPCTLWFFDKGKTKTKRKNKILFLDIKNIFTIIDKAHNEFSNAQIEYITNIVKLYRAEEPTFEFCKKEELLKDFPKLQYKDIKGLCKIADIKDVEKQSWSLNSGRYVGVVNSEQENYIFEDKIKELNNELNTLNSKNYSLEKKINSNIKALLEILNEKNTI